MLDLMKRTRTTGPTRHQIRRNFIQAGTIRSVSDGTSDRSPYYKLSGEDDRIAGNRLGQRFGHALSTPQQAVT